MQVTSPLLAPWGLVFSWHDWTRPRHFAGADWRRRRNRSPATIDLMPARGFVAYGAGCAASSPRSPTPPGGAREHRPEQRDWCSRPAGAPAIPLPLFGHDDVLHRRSLRRPSSAQGRHRLEGRRRNPALQLIPSLRWPRAARPGGSAEVAALHTISIRFDSALKLGGQGRWPRM